MSATRPVRLTVTPDAAAAELVTVTGDVRALKAEPFGREVEAVLLGSAMHHTEPGSDSESESEAEDDVVAETAREATSG